MAKCLTSDGQQTTLRRWKVLQMLASGLGRPIETWECQAVCKLLEQAREHGTITNLAQLTAQMQAGELQRISPPLGRRKAPSSLPRGAVDLLAMFRGLEAAPGSPYHARSWQMLERTQSRYRRSQVTLNANAPATTPFRDMMQMMMDASGAIVREAGDARLSFDLETPTAALNRLRPESPQSND